MARRKKTTEVEAEATDKELNEIIAETFSSPADSSLQNPTHPHPHIGDLPMRLLPHFEGLPLPEYKSEHSSGMDLSAANFEPIHLNSIGSSAMVPTGICVELPHGYEGQVRPRSGLAAKNGISIINTPGTVDADYRGEIKVLLVNLSGRRFTIERGMRIAQFVLCPVVQATPVRVEELSDTVRGEGGFGSTGY